MMKIFALLAVVLVLTVFVSGCVMPETGHGEAGEEAVTTQEEAAGAVTNMSENIGDVSSTLDDLESLFE